jgi:hypothetical protein
MPTLEQLEENDRRQAEAIAKMESRQDATERTLERHDRHIMKLDEAVTILRETQGRVATKDDILILTRSIDEKYTSHMRHAQNSVSGRIGLALTMALLICTVITVTLSLVRH